MLKYHKILIAAVLMLILISAVNYFVTLSIWWYGGIIIVTTGLLAYGSVNIRSGFYMNVICSADSSAKVIALTFDDGPDDQVTPQVLDLLKKHHLQVAFFCIGSKILKHPGLLERMDNEGHIIGGHSYSHHFMFDLFSAKRMKKELTETEKLIQRVIKKKIKLFRPPYGVTNPTLARALRKTNYTIIGWTLKSKDTVIKDEQKLYNRLVKNTKSAEIILFHDTGLHIIPVLEKFINFAKEKHYHFERLDKLLSINAYE
ncbi:MAG: polysaccharide deacetylase family protein [Bacteroidales bacterium]|nr:polysaccharide deacetylase family protein [Bacteroidales bacterium]MBN2763864.1 polysaccharide deacetylase family protein [Bacteroidales bacterium]